MATTAPAPNRRYHYVDLLRGLAAIAVLICHYRWFYARFPGDWRTDVQLPGYALLWPIYDHGEIAVPLFWTLSGFVFAVAYGRFGTGLSLREFWLRRFARLYPLHFLTLLLVAALQAVSMARFGTWQVYPNNDLPHFVEHLFLASNWFTMAASFNAPIWSVSIEEVVYFAFLLYLKSRGFSLRWAVGLALAGFVLERATHNRIALCMALFFLGVVIAVLRRRHRDKMLFTGAAGLLGLVVLVGGADSLGHGAHVPTLFIYLGAPLVLVFFIGLDTQAPELPSRFHWIGLSTYSIYLLHMPVLIALRMTVGIVPLPAFAAIVLALAVPSYRFIEAPAQNYIRARWLPSSKESALKHIAM